MNDVVFFGNTLLAWIIASSISAGVMLALLLTKRIIVRRLTSIAKKTKTVIDDAFAGAVASTRFIFIFVSAVYTGAQFLIFRPTASRVIHLLMIIVLFIQIAIWVNRVIVIGLRRHLNESKLEHATGSTMLSITGLILQFVLWTITLLLILDNLGVNITALVTGLGIGGIAVALAIQNVLGDVFASLSIALDKPFVIGDFIVVGDKLGTVEYIGLKTTRLRSLSGELIVYSNAGLLNSVIHNYKQLYERRVVFGFGVTYQTTPQSLSKIPDIVRSIIDSQSKVRFDRAHFKSYGDYSLDFEVVYFVIDPDYNVYMDIQQAINLALYEAFAKENISFAYPTRMLYVTSPPSESQSNNDEPVSI